MPSPRATGASPQPHGRRLRTSTGGILVLDEKPPQMCKGMHRSPEPWCDGRLSATSTYCSANFGAGFRSADAHKCSSGSCDRRPERRGHGQERAWSRIDICTGPSRTPLWPDSQEILSKSTWQGVEVRVADRFVPSSKTCSGDGDPKGGLDLSTRTSPCGICTAKRCGRSRSSPAQRHGRPVGPTRTHAGACFGCFTHVHLSWSLGWGLNPRPTHYECVALPLSYPGGHCILPRFPHSPGPNMDPFASR